jgi:hypothetical protein
MRVTSGAGPPVAAEVQHLFLQPRRDDVGAGRLPRDLAPRLLGEQGGDQPHVALTAHQTPVLASARVEVR